MDNLQLPAYPTTVQMTAGEIEKWHQNGETTAQFYGYTKLEKAAIILAAGDMNSVEAFKTHEAFGSYIVNVAKAVLEAANQ